MREDGTKSGGLKTLLSRRGGGGGSVRNGERGSVRRRKSFFGGFEGVRANHADDASLASLGGLSPRTGMGYTSGVG